MPDRTSSADIVELPLYHLHIGLGRLGLGLVLECLLESKPLIIMQRLSGMWAKHLKKFLAHESIELKNSVDFARKLHVRRFEPSNNDFRSEFEGALQGESFLLLYDEKDLTEMTWILSWISSVTLSVGEDGKNGTPQKSFAAWLNSSSSRKQFTVYPFENKISSAFENQPSDRPVGFVIPDRVCGGPITPSEDSKSVDIVVEPYQHVVIYAPLNEVIKTFKKADWLVVVNSKALFDYYHEKKRRLVNGLHFDLAILCYHALAKKIVPVEDWALQYMPFVMEVVLDDRRETRLCINTLIAAQSMRCLVEAKEQLNKEEQFLAWGKQNPEELFMDFVSYANNSIQRFRSASDKLGRVYDFENPEEDLRKDREHVTGMSEFLSRRREEIQTFAARMRPGGNDIHAALNLLNELHSETRTVVRQYQQRKASTNSKTRPRKK